METIKKPETIISLINTTAILGVAVYFYRRINGLEQEIDKHTQHLATTINKVKEMQVVKQHIQQLAGAIREMNNVSTAQKNELTYLRSLVTFQNDQIKELQTQTTDLGGSVKLLQQPLLQQPFFPVNQQPMNQTATNNQYQQQISNNQNDPRFLRHEGEPRVNRVHGGSQGIPSQGIPSQGLNQPGQNFNTGIQSGVQGNGYQPNLGNYQNNPGGNQGYSGGYQNNQGNLGNYPGSYQGGTYPNNVGGNQGYPANFSGGYQGGPQGNGSLIDLGGLGGVDFGTEPEENELDDQIDAVRRAKQNSNGMQLNL